MMNKSRLLTPKFLLSSMCLVAIAVFAFFASEARKEVFFLCGNFAAGHSLLSVVSQLETTNFSTYTTENTDTGKRLIHSSAINFHWQSCTIEFNQQDEVVAVYYVN